MRRPPFLSLSRPSSLSLSPRILPVASSAAMAAGKSRRSTPPQPSPSSPPTPPCPPPPSGQRNRARASGVAANRRRFSAGLRARRRQISRHRPVSGQADLAGVLRVSQGSSGTPPSLFPRAGALPPCSPAGASHGRGCWPLCLRGLPAGGPWAPSVSCLGSL
jgi:hypothetical protein